MNLSPTGHPLHTRSLTMKIHVTEDGRWRASGQVIDLRKTGFAPLTTDLQPAGLIHHMCLELLVAPDTLVLEALSAQQPVVAVEASPKTCGESCRDPASRLDVLVGETLDSDFRRKLSAAFGGPRGCTHLLSLFQFMARAVARAASQVARYDSGVEREAGETVFVSSLFIDGLHTEERNFELALQFSDFVVAPSAAVGSALEKYQHEDALRLITLVNSADMTLGDTIVSTRQRGFDTLVDAQWQERPDWADKIPGSGIMQGFAARSAELFQDEPGSEILRDGLAQLAPGLIQVLAAVVDQWITRTRMGENAEGDRQLGGGVNSCYIWREGGGVERGHAPGLEKHLREEV